MLYFDAFAGVSGDMTAGALLDLNGGAAGLREALSSLKLGIGFEAKRTNAQGIAATRFRVRAKAVRHHRTYADIRKVITGSRLSAPVRARSLDIFDVIARAEGRVHGVRPAHVHFHEVGAADSIADIVAASWLLAEAGPGKVVFSPLPMGAGTVRCQHGVLPVPAPATVEILKGVPVYSDGRSGEMVTPTGAAIARVLADGFGPVPAMKIAGIGYGAGDRKTDGPNVLRVLSGEAGETAAADVVEISANIDDMSPEATGFVFDRLLRAGALDVFLTPVQMKKNRPGTLVTVLSKEADFSRLSGLLLGESSTFGLRYRRVGRMCLERRFSRVKTRFGTVRIKEGLRDGRVVRRAPEYEDCRALAERKKVPFLDVYRAALAKSG